MSADSPSGPGSRGASQLLAPGRCERLYALRYFHKYVARSEGEPPWRLVGTLVHLCLAYFYAAQLDNPPSWFKKRTLDEALAFEGRGHPEQIRLAREVYEYYKLHYGTGDVWTPVSVEHEYRTTVAQLHPEGRGDPRVDETKVAAKCDLVVELNGAYWIVDHKCSAGSYSSDRLPQWNPEGDYYMAWQPLLYLSIVRRVLTDKPVKGFIIQRIKRKAPFDIDRNPLEIPTMAYNDIPRCVRNMVVKELDLQDRIKRGEKPFPNFGSCRGRYGACDYLSFCSAESPRLQAHIIENQFVQIKKKRS